MRDITITNEACRLIHDNLDNKFKARFLKKTLGWRTMYKVGVVERMVLYRYFLMFAEVLEVGEDREQALANLDQRIVAVCYIMRKDPPSSIAVLSLQSFHTACYLFLSGSFFGTLRISCVTLGLARYMVRMCKELVYITSEGVECRLKYEFLGDVYKDLKPPFMGPARNFIPDDQPAPLPEGYNNGGSLDETHHRRRHQ